MDFKSTIFIFGLALIFILPLVISSPVSKGIYQKKRAIDLEEVLGEEAKERVKRGGRRAPTTQKPKRIITDPTKAPGSKGDIQERGTKHDEYQGGAAYQWHIHDVGKHPRIKLGDNGTYTLDRNNPKKNKGTARAALEELDRLYQAGHKIPNYHAFRGEIDQIATTGYA